MAKEKVFVTGDMTVQEIVDLYPMTVEVLTEWGLGCSTCHIGAIETIEEGALAHGFTEEEVQEIVHDLNEIAKETKDMKPEEAEEKEMKETA